MTLVCASVAEASYPKALGVKLASEVLMYVCRVDRVGAKITCSRSRLPNPAFVLSGEKQRCNLQQKEEIAVRPHQPYFFLR